MNALNIEPALRALAAALHGEGPAVELSIDEDGALVVGHVETPGCDDAVVVVRTSGSTGAPKATVLTVESLAASSMATALALKGEGQWLLALPVQYVAGIQVLVRSLFAGTRPWVMDMSGGFTPEAFTEAALELTDKIRFTSLVPTQLQRLLDNPSPETLAVLRRFNAVLLGGAPAPAPLLDAARDAGVRVITTYGSAESSGGCVYNGYPLEGVSVRVAEDGRILLGGDTIAAGYLEAPDQDTGTFFEDDGVRWYRTSDLGSIDDDGRLTVLGRADDVIITGGVKVSAAHIQEELEKYDDVTAAFVAGVPSAEWGQAVAAYVALAPQAAGAATAEGGDHAVVLERAWHRTLGILAPKTVLAAPSLLMLPNGKPDRLAMTAELNALHEGK
ncbi:acyl-CoA synthetase (AMP-forming)/AMP-acid ligase II [Pseudarthrobacter phenanthrenivorans Sphe3]|uniref:Acyl-CoA synthetase (AMP-forming)/AMP-acid ligase II n=1 Tax=Pseudarthrobacter phenanthrenivorans (strain DSM 18606 / JCM 16027 / LMG 23796 / Sphe3) TaxID=930171 RepID=F0M2Q3_PSEPM|nr:AMP-binding protein [Pseudarthrobacter phenanthrenivorans]ADX74315.1 acyl-CoA synthetase (AMP-forming)/AMP-acid ligase II [Pseudarthrobacter phenanthrenivorans Sphe3]